MTKIQQKIMRTDFAKSLKKLIILMVCVGLLGGGLSAVMLAPQIRESISYVQKWEQEKDNWQEDRGWEQGKDSQQENPEWENRLEHRGGKEDRYHEGHDFFENAPITRPTTAAVITVGVTCFLSSLCIFFFWILVAAWLYQAAVRSGMNGLLWLAAGIFGNVFAAIAFWIVRSFVRRKCPSCGSFQSAKAHYCSNCGTAMYKKCEACGELCTCGDKFCHACGKQLHENED